MAFWYAPSLSFGFPFSFDCYRFEGRNINDFRSVFGKIVFPVFLFEVECHNLTSSDIRICFFCDKSATYQCKYSVLAGKNREEVKRGAILFFDRHPEELFFHAVVRCTQFKGTDKFQIIDDKTFVGPLYSQYEQALSWIMDKVRLEYVIKGTGSRVEKWELPLEICYICRTKQRLHLQKTIN